MSAAGGDYVGLSEQPEAAVDTHSDGQAPAAVRRRVQVPDDASAVQAPWMRLPVEKQGPYGLASELAKREATWCSTDGRKLPHHVNHMAGRVRAEASQLPATVEVDQNSLSLFLKAPGEGDYLHQLNCSRVIAAEMPKSAAGTAGATFFSRTSVSAVVTSKRLLFTSQDNQNLESFSVRNGASMGTGGGPSLSRELRASLTRQVGHQAWHTSLALGHLTGIEVDSRQQHTITGTVVRNPSWAFVFVAVMLTAVLVVAAALAGSNDMWIATAALSPLAAAAAWILHGRVGSYSEPALARACQIAHTVRIGAWDPLYHRHLIYTLEADVNACSGQSLLNFVRAVSVAIHSGEAPPKPVHAVNSV